MDWQWNALFISRVHIIPFISNYEVSILREVKRPLSSKNIVQDLVAGFRSETFPHTKQLGAQQVDDDGSVKDFNENLVGFYLPGYTICFKPSFRICIKRPPPCPPSHNMWKNIEMQNQPLSKLVKLGECYQLVPKCSESQSEYSS